MRPSATVAAMLLSMIACASAAQAQSVGVQGGVSRNPDQVYAGVQVESSPVLSAGT